MVVVEVVAAFEWIAVKGAQLVRHDVQSRDALVGVK
jgi:hypothetical protein